MHPDAREFFGRYLSLVATVLLSVSFFAFLYIPYHLGGHLGEPRLVQAPTPVATPAADSAG